MFTALLRLQWKSARAWILAGALAAASLPVASIGRRWPSGGSELAVFLAQLDAWSLFYPALALVLGLVVAGLAWRDDRRGGFVYALTLPVDQRRYVGYRFGVGLVSLTAVGAALWLAAILTVALTPIPDSLRTYPGALALKFTLLAGSAFAVGFVLMGLPDRPRRLLVRLAAALVVLQIMVLLLGWQANWVSPLLEALSGRFGPFGLLGGRWMLIDV